MAKKRKSKRDSAAMQQQVFAAWTQARARPRVSGQHRFGSHGYRCVWCYGHKDGSRCPGVVPGFVICPPFAELVGNP